MLHQYSGLLLLAVFIDGTVAGCFLMVGITRLRQTHKGHMIRRRQAIEEQAALKTLEESPVEIDDDCMLCPICWESRHPGLVWSLHIGSPCVTHRPMAPELYHREEDQCCALAG